MNWFLTWILLINISIIVIIGKSMIWWLLIVVIVFTICFSKSIFQKLTKKKILLALGITGLILIHFGIIHQQQPVTFQPRIQRQKVIIKEQYPTFYIVENKQGKKWYLSKIYYLKSSINYLELENYDQLMFCGKEKIINNNKFKQWLWQTTQVNKEIKITLMPRCPLKIQKGKLLINQTKNYLRKNHKYRSWEWIKFLLFQQTTHKFRVMKNQISALGILHLFVISGFHLFIWTKFWFWIAQKQRRNYWQITLEIIGLISCGFLVYLTDWKVSALKSFILLIGTWIQTKINYKNHNRKEQIALIALCFLIWQPTIFWKVNFQLSFLATWLLFEAKNNQSSAQSHNIQKMLYKNLLITIFILPIIVQFNQHIPILSPLYNLLFAMLMMVFYPLFFLLIWIPVLSIGWEYIFQGLETGIIWINQKTNIVLPFAFQNDIWIGVYYILIICFYALYRYFGHGKEIFLLSVWGLTMLLIVFFEPRKQHYYLHMINVGHGLVMLLHNPQKTTNILLDAGWGKSKINTSNKIIKYLIKNQIYHLNAVFLSHHHTDHHNNIETIYNTIPVEKIFTNNKQQAQYRVNEIIFKNWAYLFYYKMKKENNRGFVLQTTINNHNLLFPFDLEKKGEKELLHQRWISQIDLLQVGHHGSLTSSHQAFLKKIKPQYCLVSARKIPKITQEKFKENKCRVWTTGLNGNIVVKLAKQIQIVQNL